MIDCLAAGEKHDKRLAAHPFLKPQETEILTLAGERQLGSQDRDGTPARLVQRGDPTVQSFDAARFPSVDPSHSTTCR